MPNLPVSPWVAFAIWAVVFFLGGGILASIISIFTSKAAREQQKIEANRPHLAPTRAFGRLPIVAVDVPSSTFDRREFWNSRSQGLTLKNTGRGVAHDAFAVALPWPRDPGGPDVLPPQFSLRFEHSIPSGQEENVNLETGGTMFRCEDRIGSIQLGVPKELRADAQRSQMDRRDRIEVRLTISYRDIFNRKYASVFDLTSLLEWHYVGTLEGIEKDLLDLDVDRGDYGEKSQPDISKSLGLGGSAS